MVLMQWLFLLTSIPSVFCFESVLDNSLYFIDWQDTLQKSTSERVSMVMTTNNNEHYQCLLPPTINPSSLNNGDTTAVQVELEVLKNLMDSKICSYRIETYWTYELCHGKSVRQFHDHVKPVALQEYMLGVYTKERYQADSLKAREERQLGNRDTAFKTKKVYGSELRYYQVTYADGTVCDLTGQARKTHVQYVCHENGGGDLYDIKETSSCEYEAVVLTKDLCLHPDYGTKKSRIRGIECHPLHHAPTRPLNYQSLLREKLEGRFHQAKAKLVTSLWDIVYGLADEEEEIKNMVSSNTGLIVEEDAASVEMHQKQQQKKPQQQPQQQQPQQQQPQQQQPQQQPPQQQQQQQPPQQQPQPPQQQQQPQPPQQPQQPQPPQQPQQLPDIAYKDILHTFLMGEQCISGGNGWWKHEVCHKNYVRQFHESGGSEIVLGRWSEGGHVGWVASSSKLTKHTTGRKFVVNYYGGGDYCEEIKQNRFVLVRLECIDGSKLSKGFTIYLLETTVCKYELVVQSSMFCDVIDSAQDNGLLIYP